MEKVAIFRVLVLLSSLVSLGVNAYTNTAAIPIESLDTKAILADLTGGFVCLESEPACESLWATASKEWKSAPSKNTHILAAMGPLNNEPDGQDFTIHVGLIVKNGSAWGVLQKARPFALTDTLPMGGRSLTIDTAAYKISPTETAFGIRSGFDYASTAYSESIQSLTLYRLVGNSLHVILSVPISSSFYQSSVGEKEDRINPDFTKIVVVSATKTGGYFDLEIREKGGARDKNLTYVWQGDHYREKN